MPSDPSNTPDQPRPDDDGVEWVSAYSAQEEGEKTQSEEAPVDQVAQPEIEESTPDPEPEPAPEPERPPIATRATKRIASTSPDKALESLKAGRGRATGLVTKVIGSIAAIAVAGVGAFTLLKPGDDAGTTTSGPPLVSSEAECTGAGGIYLTLESDPRCIAPGGVAVGSMQASGTDTPVWSGPGLAGETQANQAAYQQVGVIPAGSTGVTLTGFATEDGLWYQVEFGGVSGWVLASSLAPVGTTTATGGLPSALDASSIPVASIDQGWVVALYSDAPANFSADGITVVYLVSPAGDRYELASFDSDGMRPVGVGNLANSGDHAFLVGWDPAVSDTRTVFSIAIPSGVVTQVKSFDTVLSIGSTLPTGRDVVVSRTEGGEDILDMYRTSGSLFSEIVRRPEAYPPLTWLYSLDGTELLVGETDGIHVYSNQGVDTRMLAALPGGGVCRPVRWWDAATVLTACQPQWALDANGTYEVLWLFPYDGSAPTPLTQDPPPGFQIVDFGHANAWQTSGGTILQWTGESGFSALHLLQSGGSTSTIAYQGPAFPWVVAQAGDDLVVHDTAGFGNDFGPLLLVRPDGSVVRELVPQVPGYMGVISVAGMIPTP